MLDRLMWVVAAVAGVGIMLNIHGHMAASFMIWTATNICHAAYGAHVARKTGRGGLWARVAVDAAFTGLCIYGVAVWV